MNRRSVAGVRWMAMALLLAGLLAACGQSTIEIGMLENHLPGRWEASYTTFSGAKIDRIRAEAGETLVLEYEVQVDKGDLSLRVDQPGGEPLWNLTVREDAQNTVQLPIEEAGTYSLIIEGDNTGGSFTLSWQLE